MAYTSAQYNAESRTVTPQGAGSSHQAWKRTATSAAATADARTAAPEVHAGRYLHEELIGAGSNSAGPRSFETALSMSEPAPATDATTTDSLSFDDFIDVVNPLQHLPLINLLYRELTGDSIGPVAQIIGGGIYGGPVGAVSGTVNAVVQESTGKDIAGNVLALVMNEDGSYSAPDAAPASIDRDNPEMALSLAAARYTGETYVPLSAPEPPPTAMGFNAMREATAAYEKVAMADGRTAGWSTRATSAPALDVDYSPAVINLDNLPARDSITVMPMNGPSFGGLY